MLGNMRFVAELIKAKMLNQKLIKMLSSELLELDTEEGIEALVVFLHNVGDHYDRKVGVISLRMWPHTTIHRNHVCTTTSAFAHTQDAWKKAEKYNEFCSIFDSLDGFRRGDKLPKRIS